MWRVRAQIGLNNRIASRWDGSGVTVAVLDTGIMRHPDFQNRIIAFKDFVNHTGHTDCYDDSGHGTHVIGCLAGNGNISRGKYRGVAPGVNLVVGKVLNQDGDGAIRSMIEGIEWVIAMRNRYNIRVLNISVGVGSTIQEEYQHSLINTIEKAWNSGIVVVAAAGNNGPKPMSISPIGATGDIITVGCHDGNYKSEHLCEHYSGRGPTLRHMKKPDIVAPGTDIVSCSNRIRWNGRNYTNAYHKKSGTSMATPLISGAVALLLQKEPMLSNKEVKRRLVMSATDLNEPWAKQGWGMLNIESLL